MSKKLVSILVAIYKPNVTWLTKQLASIENQAYDNLEVIIWNDNPDDYSIENVIKENFTRMPYKYYKSSNNMGSNKVFEELTKLAHGEYISYCDQDDIWLPKKIDTLVKIINDTESDMVCSDVYVIDSNDNIISDSIEKVRPHQIFYTGKDQYGYLLLKNYVIGCTMIIKKEIACAAIPFPKYTVHDWWLAIFTSLNGKITICHKPLIMYRIHDNNQTGTLNGIYDKETYFQKHILFCNKRLLEVKEHLEENELLNKYIEWSKVRCDYYKKFSFELLIYLFNHRNYNRLTTYFEIVLHIIPDRVFSKIINLIKKGKI